MSNLVLQAKNIIKSYSQGDEVIEILRGATLDLNKGEVAALVGPSGSGKSTLLHILGLLDRPGLGSIIINQKECNNLSDIERTNIRSHHIGFIYQFHHLLSEFTALENVAMPLLIQGNKKKIAYNKAYHMLTSLGLKHRINHLPSELSGGEQQRAAIARAIVTKPSLILADEPTGNLDPENSLKIFKMLIDVVKQENLSAIIVTHNLDLANLVSKTYHIDKGKIYLK